MPPPWAHRHRRGEWHGRHQRRRGWHGQPHRWHPPSRWAWLLHARMRLRVFLWFGLVMALALLARRGVEELGGGRWSVIAAFAAVWIASGMLAWQLTRPLLAVIDAARRIGEGELSTRIKTRHGGEIRVLADAINDMAVRLERQHADQRELLAAVSHELRTPLGHMRILIETDRDRGGDSRTLAELDSEIARLDDLVGRLLASSRLDFGQLDLHAVDLGALAADVATRSQVAPDRITADEDTRAEIDPTLVRRALANLIDNARVHGGGAIAVRVERRGDDIALEVDDAGPGVPEARRADAGRAFATMPRGASPAEPPPADPPGTPASIDSLRSATGGGLGLGLALVHRIAHAHGGRFWIEDRPGGGARVGFAVPVVPAARAVPAEAPEPAAPKSHPPADPV